MTRLGESSAIDFEVALDRHPKSVTARTIEFFETCLRFLQLSIVQRNEFDHPNDFNEPCDMINEQERHNMSGQCPHFLPEIVGYGYLFVINPTVEWL
jgi:hypothetical protein